MDNVGAALAMLAAVLVSGGIVRVFPLPLPLVQIALGFFIAAVSDEGTGLHPDVFFLLFLPPLLFLDGWRIPKEGLLRDRVAILQLAFGLVLLSVLGMGYFIHWMIPSMPLTVAFALAAIISPTDPVAVSALTRRSPIPKRALLVLEGESLFNDASGLLAFRFAVAATATGTFSLTSAFGSFLWMAIAGVAIGAGAIQLIVAFRNWFIRRFGEEPGSEILLSLLAPFAAYFLAEYAQASGILAAVAAGLAMSYEELSGKALALTRIRREVVWDLVYFALNGVMFVLLGEQLPHILDGAVFVVKEAGHRDVSWLAVYPVVICVVLAAIRFLWVFFSLKVNRRFSTHHEPNRPPITMRLLLVLSLAGVRGTITLAGVMTLPLFLPNGANFPARDLAIFLAAMVIIISLVAASVGLPLVLRGQTPMVETRYREQEAMAKGVARDAALKSVGQVLNQLIASDADQNTSLYTEVATQVLADLQQDDQNWEEGADRAAFDLQRATERKMRLAAIDASRRAIYQLARTHRISDQMAREFVRQLDLQEVRLN